MRLAIASPVSSAYSETFIHMQYERLPCKLRIHGMPVARETVPGGPILPLKNLRGLWDCLIDIGFRGAKWEGPQRRELMRRLKKNKIQVLLTNYGPYAVAHLPVTRALRIPLVVHFHGYDAHRMEVLQKQADAYRQMGREAAAVIVVSNKMFGALREFGMPATKLHLVRYGVNTELFSPRTTLPETPTFLAVGRFVDKKAPYLTLLAFARVHARFPRARLILVGDGPLRETTRNLAVALDLWPHAVEFPGALAHDKIATLMREATAFVQHSLTPELGTSAGDSEGTPVAVLEAMMTGLPVVATRHAGIGEVVEHGRTGLLVEERDVEGMARAMIQVAENPEMGQQLGLSARQVALSRYTADHYIQSLQLILETVHKTCPNPS
jgi:glycosyltransferase involved in cell wall biosynthesis